MSEEARAALIQKRGRIKGTLTRIRTFSENISSDTPIDDIKVRIQNLDTVWKEFCTVEDILMTYEGQVSEMEEYERKYFESKSAFMRAIGTREQSVNPQENVFNLTTLNSTMNQLAAQQQSFFQNIDRSQVQPSITRLPSLNIPIFSGDCKEWSSFKDLFESSIHSNESLSGSQKFQYLKGLLKGNSAALIRHLPVSETSYNEAWEKLKARFNKPLHIAMSFIKTFAEQSAVPNSSIRALRHLADTSDEVIRGLKSLGREAEGRDPWLLYLISQKLDSESREAWSQEIVGETFPTFDKFLNFLNKRCDALEAANSTAKRSTQSVKTLHNSVLLKSYSSSCTYCQANHPLYLCPNFKEKSVNDRRSFVLAKSICFRCLGSNHSVKVCRSKIKCRQCKGNHHWLLHPTNQSELSSSTNSNSKNSSVNLPSSHSPINSSRSTTTINRTSSHSSINPSNSRDAIKQSNPDFMMNSPSDHLSSSDLQQKSQPSSFNTYANQSALIQDNYIRCNQPSIALLPTALCHVKDYRGQFQLCRLLLDSGSQISLISQHCALRLGMKGERSRLSVSGLSDTTVGVTKGKIRLDVYPRWHNSPAIKVIAFVMENLSHYTPPQSCIRQGFENITDFNLADPDFHKSCEIDIILGADKFFDVLSEGKWRDNSGNTIAHETVFGWVITGGIMKEPLAYSLTSTVTNLDKILECFWKAEEINAEFSTISEEEKAVERHFQNTVTRDTNGRYVVCLPFTETAKPLGNSFRNAIIRLHSVERRFAKDTNYKNAYIEFMREYERLHHMEPIPQEEIHAKDDRCFYLPHHAVFKNSPDSKIRVVFDGSARTTSGVSLNNILLVGPQIQRDLASILISFRQHQVAITADVQKMYRQVLVASQDRDYQRILWRENPTLPIKHYRLKTVTYGTSSAPFLATKVLHQISEEHKTIFPKAATIIQQDFYVDDLLSGAESLSDAIELKEQLMKMLSEAGFPLVKWRSNSSSPILNNAAPEKEDFREINDNTDITKVLGMHWNSIKDTFSFKITENMSDASTKRKLLSESSRLFDPLGLLAPVVIIIKILFQQLWLLKYDWDEDLPKEIVRRWENVKLELPAVSQIEIPRLICCGKGSIQLHGFADASERAYAAVIYCRTEDNQEVIVRLIAAKTKVAPLKLVSLPRLELCAAVLLTRLMKKVTNSLSIQFTIRAWTDSAIVLAWLSDIPRRWNSYVANRTAEIIETIPRSQWRHVSSRDNPADCASRGINPKELVKHYLWWQGPTWLLLREDNWPVNRSIKVTSDVQVEERKPEILSHFHEITYDIFDELFSRCSSFYKVRRVIAYCLRFIFSARAKAQGRKCDIPSVFEVQQAAIMCTALEAQEATTMCIKSVQTKSFQREIKCLTSKKSLPAGSPLIKLSPFLDSKGILRVGGRLQNSGFNFNAQHPIIIPKNHTIATLLARDAHKIHLHPGPSLLTSIIRQRFWILGVRNLARKIYRECMTCFKQKAAVSSQLMGSLPKPRVNISRPFSQVGVDCAGPLMLSSRTGRGSKLVKGYIALFVCFATKAIHLELVSNLSSEAFLAALRRFAARRGIPADIYSDNGTNFKGATTHINELHKLALSCYTDPLISIFLEQSNVTWHFIPPGAPHFGGLWEAAVGSVKWHLRRVLGESHLGFEEMTTLLTQVEAILNSRPICAASSDIDDLNAITPGHFLIGQAPTTLPEGALELPKTPYLHRWRLIQAMFQGFWKQWRSSYLSSLQERNKWTSEQPQLQEGDLVVLKEDNIPPTQWPLGRILQVYPGTDKLVRVVLVKTAKGNFKRAITRVARLPIS